VPFADNTSHGRVDEDIRDGWPGAPSWTLDIIGALGACFSACRSPYSVVFPLSLVLVAEAATRLTRGANLLPDR
jgi:hypothetical protein